MDNTSVKLISKTLGFAIFIISTESDIIKLSDNSKLCSLGSGINDIFLTSTESENATLSDNSNS